MKPQLTSSYDKNFYDFHTDGALRSARIVVPIVLDLICAKSVVDFGCGRAAWLKAFRENGVDTVLGLDGDYVDKSKLLIGENEFLTADFEKPITLDRRFDIAVCLEVVEHLTKSASHALLRSLSASSEVILFSAAIPGQKGTRHINEQWPEYWEKVFAGLGFKQLDIIRPLVWQDEQVEWWYRQNLYIYATEAASQGLRGSSADAPMGFGPHLELIGEDVLSQYKTFRGLLAATFAAGVRALKQRVSLPRR